MYGPQEQSKTRQDNEQMQGVRFEQSNEPCSWIGDVHRPFEQPAKGQQSGYACANDSEGSKRGRPGNDENPRDDCSDHQELSQFDPYIETEKTPCGLRIAEISLGQGTGES